MRDSKLKLILGTIACMMTIQVGAKNRLIIKYRPFIQAENFKSSSRLVRKKFNSKKEMNKEMEALKKSSLVEYVEVDTMMTTQQVQTQYTPNDSRVSEQWALNNGDGAIEAQEAWDSYQGNSSTVVAVVDTGIVNHSDINSKILPGYDMVSDSSFANDGDGRDSDPSDPGDWISYGDSCYQGQTTNSSWHGTHVAGIIAAQSGNSKGIAGVNWNAKILPVRALGKCGGYTSDIADAVKWAAGVAVSGVPNNQNPASVINLSLGGSGPCSAYMQDAINQAKAKGAVVVVAAGNSSANLDTSEFTPANCQGVLVVGANTQNGYQSYFSNYGKIVDVSAPGGGNGSSIISLGNTGSTGPSSESYTYQSGTSMSAPHVAGIVSLMKGVNPGLYPDQLMALVKEAAKGFPWSSGCESGECGSGIALAWRSIELAASESPDPHFQDDEDASPGTAPISQGPTLNTTTGSGGLCGSVSYTNSKSGRNSGGGSLFMVIGFVLLIIRFLRRKETGVS